MPFEPLQTDEKLTGPVSRQPDTDTVMLFGCTHFVFAAIIAYGLGIAPFFLINDQHIGSNLLVSFGIGVGVSRKTFVVGACGYIGGIMAASTFLLLRIQQILLAKDMRDLPQPDFPDSWVWILPVTWTLFALFLALIVVLASRRLHTDPAEDSR